MSLHQILMEVATKELLVQFNQPKQNTTSDHDSAFHRTHECGSNTSIRSRYTQEVRHQRSDCSPHQQQHTPATTNTQPTALGTQLTTTSVLTVNQPTASTSTDNQPSADALSYLTVNPPQPSTKSQNGNNTTHRDQRSHPHQQKEAKL
ncbi:hypothetical protein E2C01_028476 [Portunus trituberculatus]|uniref:Uncharacterized protein n=1 Tax=Portunus trituberculatus TaxID=210409 RepID=A0A5B7ENR0_PORTR|nr:hypothetical protein [Portunus trituberculatus]